jgi:hypothetical protein
MTFREAVWKTVKEGGQVVVRGLSGRTARSPAKVVPTLVKGTKGGLVVEARSWGWTPAFKLAAETIRAAITSEEPGQVLVEVPIVGATLGQRMYPVEMEMDPTGHLKFVVLKSRKPMSREWREENHWHTDRSADVGEVAIHKLVSTTVSRGRRE